MVNLVMILKISVTPNSFDLNKIPDQENFTYFQPDLLINNHQDEEDTQHIIGITNHPGDT